MVDQASITLRCRSAIADSGSGIWSIARSVPYVGVIV